MRYPLFVVAAGGCLVIGSCGRNAATGIQVPSAFQRFVSPDAKALVSVDLEKLKVAPLYRAHENDLQFPLLDGASEKIGLDPRKDVSSFLVVWNGKQPLFLATGRFNATAVQGKLGSLGAVRTTYRDHAVLEIDRISIVFPRNSMAVGGETNVLRSALDAASGSVGGVPEELKARLAEVPKRAAIWAVSRGGLPLAEVPMPSEYESALSNLVGYVNGTSVGIEMDTGLHVGANIICPSKQAAQRVHDGLRAGIAIGRLTTKSDQPDLLRIYDAIEVDQDQQIVRIRADFPADLADRLVRYLTKEDSSLRRR